MKLQGRAVDDFVRGPHERVRGVLVYGPDEGQVRERAAEIARRVVPDAADPFRIFELACDAVAADPSRLIDEANSLSLTPGRRLLHLRDAPDKVTPACQLLAKAETAPDCLLLVEGGDLSPRSPLRKLFEADPTLAAIACYVDDEKALGTLIRDMLRADSITADADAVAYLAQALAGDRALVRRALEKLALYIGPAPAGAKAGARILHLEQAVAAVGDAGALELDDPARAAADGDRAATDRAVRRLSEDGVASIAVLRAAQGHFRRLHLARAAMARGQSADSAMASLRPPVFFKQAPQFRRQLERWRLPMIATALGRLIECEAASKRTGAPDELLLSRAFTLIAQMPHSDRRPVSD